MCKSKGFSYFEIKFNFTLLSIIFKVYFTWYGICLDPKGIVISV